MLYYDSKKRDNPGDYFPLPKSIFNLDLSTGEIVVYAYLMYCEDRKTFQCHPSYSTIGSATGMSKNALQYRAAEVGHTVRFGRFEQDNDLGNGKEDIEWTVIGMQDGKLMLLADYVLDCRQYYTANPEKYYTWADSDICDWLNNDFLREAFLEGERDSIVRVPVVTYEEGPQTSQTAYLKVFLLSHEEYYGFDTSIKREYIDQIRLSAYTEARYSEGFHKTGAALVRNHFIFRDANKDGLYYLTGNSKAAYVNYSTSRMHGYYNIRPVIWLEYER